jgi:uncharacterized protein (DUF169 family)
LDRRALATEIAENLGLELAPVALAFRDAPPAGIAVSEAVVPSACAFWRQAEQGVFFAPVAGHAHCPIGAFVMGFELGDELMAELQELIGRMTACGYVHKSEPAAIPTHRRRAKGILYGPLADFPEPPDAVLLWLRPDQAMIWSEATGGACWTAAAPSTVSGRPACAAIPAAMDSGGPALSFGCVGMRTFTKIPADRMLAVVPGPRLAELAEAIARTVDVNRSMRGFYEGRLDDLNA